MFLGWRNASLIGLSVPLAMLPLLALYLLFSLGMPQPYMTGVGWGEAVAEHLPPAQSSLALLAVFERAYLLLDLSLQWALQNMLGGVDDSGALALLLLSTGLADTLRFAGHELSSYGHHVGGLPGAVQRGFERQYYDLFDRSLADWLNGAAKPGTELHFEPNHNPSESRKLAVQMRLRGTAEEKL